MVLSGDCSCNCLRAKSVSTCGWCDTCVAECVVVSECSSWMVPALALSRNLDVRLLDASTLLGLGMYHPAHRHCCGVRRTQAA